MLIIGLTGGIGSGKSAAAARFAQHNIPVIDADIISREVVSKNSPGLHQITETFGKEYLTEDGELNRAKLRQHIFPDPNERKKLEAILHPLIRKEMLARTEQITAPYCIFVIPLLIESKQASIVDRILVIDCPEETQRNRVMDRDKNTLEEINAIMDSQTTRASRLAAADDVVLNEGTLDELNTRIDKLHQQYLQLANA